MTRLRSCRLFEGADHGSERSARASRSAFFNHRGLSLRNRAWEGEAVKPFVFGAMILWLVSGIVGAWMEGQQRLDVPTILGGPVTLWNGMNQPADNWVS